jgi:hypothetical protein
LPITTTFFFVFIRGFLAGIYKWDEVELLSLFEALNSKPLYFA